MATKLNLNSRRDLKKAILDGSSADDTVPQIQENIYEDTRIRVRYRKIEVALGSLSPNQRYAYEALKQLEPGWRTVKEVTDKVNETHPGRDGYTRLW